MQKELIETEVKFSQDKQQHKMIASGPGKHLQAVRTAANLSLESVAIALHLTTQMVTDLEEDHYENFAGHTFIRGYLRNYARLLRLSPDDIIAAFNKLDIVEQESDKPKLALKTTSKPRSSALLKWVLPIVTITLLVMGGWFTLKHFGTIRELLKKQNVPTKLLTLPPSTQQEEVSEDLTHAVTIEPEQVLKTAQTQPVTITPVDSK
jgi:cytoskeleton protein RodZ